MQVHKIVAGIGPLRPLVRIAAAARQLLSIPLEQLWQRPSSSSGAVSEGKGSLPVSWQLQRSLAGLPSAFSPAN